MFSKTEPLLLASGVLVALAAFPGLPKIPFLLMGVGVGALRLEERGKTAAPCWRAEKQAKPAPARENLESLLHVEPLSVELGLGLVKMVEGGTDSPLLRRIAASGGS